MPCPTFEDWAAFLDGETPEGERAPLVRHLVVCADCRALFLETGTSRQTFVNAGRATPVPAAPAQDLAPLVRALEAGRLDDLQARRLAADPLACYEVFLMTRLGANADAETAPDAEKILGKIRPLLAAPAAEAAPSGRRTTRRASVSRRLRQGDRHESSWTPFIAVAAAALLAFVAWRANDTTPAPRPGTAAPAPVAVVPKTPVPETPVAPAVPPPASAQEFVQAPAESDNDPVAGEPPVEAQPAATPEFVAAPPADPANPQTLRPSDAPTLGPSDAPTVASPSSGAVKVTRTWGSVRQTSPESFVSGYATPGGLETADGDRIVLRPRAELTLGSDPAARLFVLKSGDAAFEVAKADRPFVVRTEFGDATALGTRYVVGVEEKRMRLAVLESAVLLKTPTGEARVEAGRETATSGGAIEPVREIADVTAYAWSGAGRGAGEEPWMDGVPGSGKKLRGLVIAVPRGGRELHADVMAEAAGEALEAGVVTAHGWFDPARKREIFVYLPVEGAARKETEAARAAFVSYTGHILRASGQNRAPVPMLIEMRGHSLVVKGKRVEETHILPVGFSAAALEEAKRAYATAAAGAGFGAIPLMIEGEGFARFSLATERTEGSLGPRTARRGAAFLAPASARKDPETAARYGRVLARAIEALYEAR